jgi:hypothetical protein
MHTMVNIAGVDIRLAPRARPRYQIGIASTDTRSIAGIMGASSVGTRDRRTAVLLAGPREFGPPIRCWRLPARGCVFWVGLSSRLSQPCTIDLIKCSVIFCFPYDARTISLRLPGSVGPNGQNAFERQNLRDRSRGHDCTERCRDRQPSCAADGGRDRPDVSHARRTLQALRLLKSTIGSSGFQFAPTGDRAFGSGWVRQEGVEQRHSFVVRS